MNRFYALSIFVFLAVSSFGQGLNGEVGLNDHYNQKYQAGVVCVDEYSYFVKRQFLQAYTYVLPSSLLKIDTLGNILWEVVVSPDFEDNGSGALPDITEVYKVIPSEDGGVYIMGYANGCCDCPSESFWFIQKIDGFGTKLWIKKWHIADIYAPYNERLTGMTYSNNELLVNFRRNTEQAPNPPQIESVIYSLNLSDGTIIDSLVNLSEHHFSQINGNNHYEMIASKDSTLYAFDSGGVLVNSLSYGASVKNILTINDTVFVLTSDTIFSYSSDLVLLNENPLTDYSNCFNLKAIGNQLHFFADYGTDKVILRLDHDLNTIQSQAVPNEVLNFPTMDFSDTHLSAVQNFALSERTAVRHVDYSLLSAENKDINRTDVGVVDLDFYDITVEYIPQAGFHWYSVSAKALVKNFGNKTVTECRINHNRETFLICGENFYSQRFTNLNIAPGDSAWIDLGLFHQTNNTPVLGSDSSLNLTLCVYSSNPNALVDLNVSNDKLCKSALLGYLGIPTATLDHSEKKLVKIVDLLGKEIEKKPNTLMIYIYDDGTTEKMLIAE